MKHGKSPATPTPEPTPTPPPLAAPELYRRVVVLFVTGLIVARPLVLGEDPGLLDPLSDPGSLLLALLWLAAGVLWCVWRAWSGESFWHGGRVELALLALVGVQFVSAGVAAQYKHPAWLVAWEWLVVLVAFVLVRQLAAPLGEYRLFLAAVMATAICLSAEAIYQAAWDIPRIQMKYSNRPEALRADLAAQGEVLEADDPRLERYLRRIQEGHVTATYAHPNSFAGYLVLLIPTAVGFVVVAWRQRREQWQTGLLATAAVLLLLSLWFTHSRGGMLALLVAGGAAALWAGRDFVRRHAQRVGVVALVLVGLAALAFASGWADSATGKQSGSFSLRLDYWRATAAMIRDHPWFGVGPGNFGRHYPLFMLPRATELIKDPHNFALELWATGGVFALLAGLVALGLVFWQSLRPQWSSAPPEERPGDEVPRTPWEFYLGGMLGLLLAFTIRTTGLRPEEIGDEAFQALLRSVVWFGTFALYALVPWSGRSLALALTAGLAALLINLLISGGISFPSVAQPMWVVAALALAAAGTGELKSVPRSALRSLGPLPVALAAGIAFFLLAFSPVVSCDGHRKAFQRARFTFRQAYQKHGAAAALDRWEKVRHPLQNAILADPLDTGPLSDRAAWSVESAEYLKELKQENRSDEYRGLRYIKPAVESLEQARQLDPLGREILLQLFHVYLRFGLAFEDKRDEHLKAAEGVLGDVVTMRPADAARLHFDLAGAYAQVKNDDAKRRQAQLALDLDESAPGPTYKLTDRQRQQAREWVKPRAGG